MPRLYGSFNNRLMENVSMETPEVGTPATCTMWSDRYAAVVTKVISPTKIEMTEVPTTAWKDCYGVAFGEPSGETFICTRDKQGRWRKGTRKGGDGVVFGQFGSYRDPSF